MHEINKECSLRGKRADPATGSLVILLGGAVVQRLKEKLMAKMYSYFTAKDLKQYIQMY